MMDSVSNGAKRAQLLPVSAGIVTLLKSRSIKYVFCFLKQKKIADMLGATQPCSA